MRFRRAASGAAAANKPPRSTSSRIIIAALAGAAGVLAFAPFGWWPLQIVSLAILFYQVLRGASVKSGVLIGWAYGFGWCGAGVHWLFIALHRFGGLAAPLAALAIALLAVFMGTHLALAMGFAAWLRRRCLLPLALMNLLVLPAMWALSEWLRGWLFTGFSWVSAGYAHNASPLAGFAPVIGVYGLGWLSALCAGALLLLAHRTRWLAAGLIALVLGAGLGLQAFPWTHAAGKPITVRLLQGNVAQDEKFNASHIQVALDMYAGAIRAERADLIATPETAIALFPFQLPPDYLASLGRFAQQSNSHLLVGIPLGGIPLTDSPTLYSNSAIGFSPAGAVRLAPSGAAPSGAALSGGAGLSLSGAAPSGAAPSGTPPYRYDKHHLVPFGEFIPAGFRWFVDLMAIPLGDFNRGAVVQAPFQVGDQRVLPNICYEDLFGEEIAEQLAAPQETGPATILLNLSNLAWYGESIAIAQHLQISQMRSLETGRPMLRATNTGATAVIDGRGQVVKVLPPNTRGTLAATVQGMVGMTPYILLGNKLILGICMLALLGACLLARNGRKKGAKTR